jgi:hypothetical protein
VRDRFAAAFRLHPYDVGPTIGRMRPRRRTTDEAIAVGDDAPAGAAVGGARDLAGVLAQAAGATRRTRAGGKRSRLIRRRRGRPVSASARVRWLDGWLAIAVACVYAPVAGYPFITFDDPST